MSTDDSDSGAEGSAFMDPNSNVTERHRTHVSGDTTPQPPTVQPSATISRSQALARLRRGESNPHPSPSAPKVAATSGRVGGGGDGSSSSPPRRTGRSMNGVEDSSNEAAVRDCDVTTSQRMASEDTSSPIGGQRVTPVGDGREGKTNTRAPRPRVSPPPDDTAEVAVFTQAHYKREHRQHRHREDSSSGAEEEEREGTRGNRGLLLNMANDGGEEDARELEMNSPMKMDKLVHEGLHMTVPVATVPRRGLIEQRMAATALPRLLMLQRSFEAEAPHLYEFCATQVVEWPALALDWIPDRAFTDPERDYTLHYLAVGSQAHPTSGSRNTVMVMEVAVPVPATTDVMYGLYGDDDVGGGSNETDPELRDGVDPGKRFVNVKGHFHCEQTLYMDAPVLKIRAMPAETNILAVKTASGFVGIYNTVQQLDEDERGCTVPDALLRGHLRGGFGLSWNTVKLGYIASASDDGYVNYYDVRHRLTIDGQSATVTEQLGGPEVHPLERLVGHRDIITDCCWHNSQGHLLASSSMDGDVRIWDIRMRAGGSTLHNAHPSGATAAQFHPVGAFQLATAGAEGGVRLWDIRRPTDPVGELNYHGRSVTGLQWSPSQETVLATHSEDGRVVLWDLAKSSLPLAYSQDGVAPPEVSFVHLGHVGRVTDVAWNAAKAEECLLASADTTNGVHLYRPLRKVVEDYRLLE